MQATPRGQVVQKMNKGNQESFQVLVVDDEPDLEPLINMRMRKEIRSGEYKFTFASNGLEALECFTENNKIDMLITDINMPQMDGLALLEQVRVQAPDVKSIVVSAYGDMRNIRTAMNRGAFDFVTKPLDFEDLRVTIERTRAHMKEWQEAAAYKDKLLSIQNELETAHVMQQAILPTDFPVRETYEIDGRMEPARNVGGDFYEVINLEGGKIGIAVADVSDKGIPAAMFMMSSRTLLKGAAIGLGDPDKVLEEVNRMLYEDNRTTMFVTVLYGVYDPETGIFVYANGGHCNPVTVSRDGTCRELAPTNGIVLGLIPDAVYQQEWTTINQGETLLIFSDGVSEAQNPHGEEFGLERLFQVLQDKPPGSARETNLVVHTAVQEFAEEMPQSDDLTCLALHRRA